MENFNFLKVPKFTPNEAIPMQNHTLIPNLGLILQSEAWFRI